MVLKNLRLFSVLAAVGLMVVSPVLAAEMDITIPSPGGDIIGTMNDAGGDTTAPVVLLLHGFTGSRHELAVADTDYGVFSYTAKVLAEEGYASLRIDFRGSGDSTALEWKQTRFSTQIADAKAALDYLVAQNSTRNLYVLGWSQGGLVAAHVAGEAGVDGVVLWAPVSRPEVTYGDLMGADLVREAYTAEPTEVIEAPLPWGGTTSLEAGFFQECLSTDPIAALAPVAAPLLVIVGSKDTTVTPQPQMGAVLTRYHQGPSELAIVDTDHSFGAFEGTERLDEMIDKTLGWLANR